MASKRLAAIGEPALAALKAAAGSRDPEVRQRAAAIIRMATRLNPIAGPYVMGNGSMRFELVVKAEDRYEYAWSGCPRDESKGTARLVQGWLTLAAEERHADDRFATTPPEFPARDLGRADLPAGPERVPGIL